MCGIVGIFIKNPSLEPELGKFLSSMLLEMTERDLDSSGAAIYRDAAASDQAKLTLLAENKDYPWEALQSQLDSSLDTKCTGTTQCDHAVIKIAAQSKSVFNQEPLPATSRLWNTPNLIITPHSSSNDPANHANRSLDILLENLSLFINGSELQNVIDLVQQY